ncbi:MAG: N-acetyl-gamma-glutamyl-phosphate reductase [Bacteroidetes bacterium]|jgi:N-acetyl-gamma-glutamyl-phosphate reductase|nr:N-acetyl-gamma-glutamyl-phosphate reductase [Bacteroidota bacterium]
MQVETLSISSGEEDVIRAGIVGASGYSGAELMRLLLPRADVSIEVVTAASSAGQRVDALYPSLAGRTSLAYEQFDSSRFAGLDVAFISLPSGEGMKVVPLLVGNVKHVIDLGGDFRLQSAETYQLYYKHQHTATALLPEAVYGLPELNKGGLKTARLVANPGCYPTSAILGLLPALVRGTVEEKGIVINALSGVSGAGRSSSVEMSFTELNENIRAYKVGNHQHIPEIQSVLSGACGKDVSLSFIPHLVPLTRGIYSTIHAQLTQKISTEDVLALYESYYADAPFVRVLRTIPELRGVTGTNYCDIGLYVQERTGQLVILSAIDNLVKGAAGQAIQNMNILFGLPEEKGLNG